MIRRLAASRSAGVLLRERIAPFRRTIGTTGGLILAAAINSATGFVFWWIAARQFPEAAVGLAGAAVSAILLLSQISVLGLGTALAGMIHREPRAASLAATATFATGAAGLLLGGIVAGVAPFISDELAPIGASPWAIGLFALGVSLTAVSAVLDQVLVAVLRSSVQLLRNVVFSLVRLFLLAAAALAFIDGMAIYGAWVLATVVSLMTVAAIPRHARRALNLLPLEWGGLRGLAFGALSHHVLNLSRSSSVWLLPALVTVLLSREANAAFYIALLLANFIAIVGTSATFTLYVVGARNPEQLWRQVRFTVGLSLATATGGTLVLGLLGQPLLSAFGPAYAEAYPAVVLLAVTTLPLGIKDHWIALQRLRGSVTRAALIGVGLLLVELAAGAAGAIVAGVAGLALARLGVLAIQAAFMVPIVYRAARRPPWSAPPLMAPGIRGDAA